LIKYKMKKLKDQKVVITIKKIEDYRNYKVTIDKARTNLGFQPRYTVTDIIENLYEHRASFEDYNKDRYYNIKVFEKLDAH